MTTAPTGRETRSSLAETVPLDLVLVVTTVLLADVLVMAAIGWAPLRFVLGAIVLFFLPGYALLAALYPERPRRTTDGRATVPQLVEPHDGLVFTERLALSFGTSVALVPIAAVTLGAFGFGLTPSTILGCLTVVVVGCALAGAVRRARLAPNNRYVPFGRRAARGDGGSVRWGYRGSRTLAIGLVLAIALTGGALAYGIATEPASSDYTSASLLTTGDDGRAVVSAYPGNATVGEPVELTLRTHNHRSQPINVTAVATLERVATDGDTVVDREELRTLSTDLGPNERFNATHEVTPTFAGEDLRLAYYLYHGAPPSSIGPQTADRELYLRIDVDEA